MGEGGGIGEGVVQGVMADEERGLLWLEVAKVGGEEEGK